MEISLRCRHALMVEDGAFSHKTGYVTFVWKILNHEGRQNCITVSRVTAMLLNGWILPISGAFTFEGLLSTGPTPSSFYLKEKLTFRNGLVLLKFKAYLTCSKKLH